MDKDLIMRLTVVCYKTVVQLKSIFHLGEAPIKVTQFQLFYLF